MSTIYDIIVVGGGIVGLGVFNRLVLNGFKNVLLVEKASQIITGASAGNSGILHTGFDATPNTLESRLIRRGYELYHLLGKDLPLPIKRIGAYMIAWNSEDIGVLQQTIHNARQNAIFDIEEVPVDVLYQREPNLRPHALGAIFIPGECIVDPMTLPLIIYMHAIMLGGQVKMNTEIIDGVYDTEHKHWSLNSGTLKSRLVINCAGLYGDLVENIRIRQNRDSSPLFTIHPRIGQFAVFASTTSALPIQSIILPIPTKFTKGIIVYPNLFDQLVVGPTAETQKDRDSAPIRSDVNQMLLNKIIELLPQFSESNYEQIGSYTGIRPATEYSDYQIHFYESQSWICCGGIRSTGLTSSLSIGEYVCDKLQQMEQIHSQLECQNFCSKLYMESIERMKSIFSVGQHGLEMKLVTNVSTTRLQSSGDIQFGESLKKLSLGVDCAGEIIEISHSLVKLARAFQIEN